MLPEERWAALVRRWRAQPDTGPEELACGRGSPRLTLLSLAVREALWVHSGNVRRLARLAQPERFSRVLAGQHGIVSVERTRAPRA